MKLLGRKNADSPDGQAANGAPADAARVDNAAAAERPKTAPKGKPTPKRNEVARKRGPVAPAPKTGAEARKRRKEIQGPKLSRAERKAERVIRRAEMSGRREKMMAGEDSYLLPRDRGPVRRYVRDVVDSRRNLLGLFMPAALAMIFIMLAVPSVQLQALISPAMLVLILIMTIDGVFLGRRANRMADEKFPDNTETGWKLGFYAASRASQLRRMRAPRPQVERGSRVA